MYKIKDAQTHKKHNFRAGSSPIGSDDLTLPNGLGLAARLLHGLAVLLPVIGHGLTLLHHCRHPDKIPKRCHASRALVRSPDREAASAASIQVLVLSRRTPAAWAES